MRGGCQYWYTAVANVECVADLSPGLVDVVDKVTNDKK